MQGKPLLGPKPFSYWRYVSEEEMRHDQESISTNL